MSSKRIEPNRLLSIVVFPVGALAVAWYSQPPTLPLMRAIPRVSPGGHFEERWVTGILVAGDIGPGDSTLLPRLLLRTKAAGVL